MAEVLSSDTPNLSWRRDLIGSKLVIWNNLAARLANITLNHERDKFKWNLDQADVFTVKSHYLGLMHQNIPYTNKKLWKFKIPLKIKIKIFLWYLKQGVILTKHNLARRNWQGS